MSNQSAAEFFSPYKYKNTIPHQREELGKLLETYSGDEAKVSEIADLLIAKYTEKHRVYHNLTHISVLNVFLAGCLEILSDEESVYLASWFHDAIYDPKMSNNETESAALAVESLSELKFPPAKIERVEQMILATQTHDAEGLDADGRLFLDVDLGILSASPEAYKLYAQAIREEYSFVPETLYREKRREILQRFQKREYIYYTSGFRRFHEFRAHANIANEIKELS